MQEHGSKYFARRQPSPDPGDRVNRSKVNFLITWSWCISNSRESQNVSADPPSPPDPGGWVQKVKSQFFKTWSCCISNKRESQTFAADPLTP